MGACDSTDSVSSLLFLQQWVLIAATLSSKMT